MRLGKDRIFKMEAQVVLKLLQITWELGVILLELECENIIRV